MPPLPAVPQVLKILVQGNSSEASPITWANVLHFRYSGTAPSAATCNSIAASVQTAWAAHVATMCPSTTVQNLCTVIDLSSNTAGSGASEQVEVGTRGDDEIPANAAVLVLYPVQRRYKGGHPRSYLLAGGNADFADPAHWSPAFINNVVTPGWKAFIQAILAISVGGTTINQLVQVSYYSGKDANGKPVLRPSPVVDVLDPTLLFAEQQMASQRRRIGRHRR